MKAFAGWIPKLMLFMLVAVLLNACSKDDDAPSVVVLSTVEKSSLQFMREEEKLARDVYRYLYELHGNLIFSNIATSEQSHMDAIKQLLVKYNITDPVATDVPGIFVNQDLQALYNKLILDGSKSVVAALTVGATIEDLDLYDLENELDKVASADIILVYNSLIKGSRNHLRSFYGQLVTLGETYTPQYITQEYFDFIINSPMERG
ncbi:DUF2202 domain-containing protein [Flavihumibacter stibioxidans]|uniref:DUF2202 domain-containing protein n=1 Tax=Flavihumibacter stibioxidans TaxID=1834163 RepID=UPI00164F72C4|nr:DUF2202 domain-containing protein [Flavihumibacter stibioxidans]